MKIKKLTKYEPRKRFTIKEDGFHGNDYRAERDRFPGKAMVIVGGSAGSFMLTEMTAEKFYEAGMNVLAVKPLSTKLFRAERKYPAECDASCRAA